MGVTLTFAPTSSRLMGRGSKNMAAKEPRAGREPLILGNGNPGEKRESKTKIEVLTQSKSVSKTTKHQ